mmetsp:Transcript_13314/g.27055  ORF Transcript_13314/g.27055 Transcript_13314/m.27055 type:complete len:92 (+) Transcript_13314:146-421(+)
MNNLSGTESREESDVLPFFMTLLVTVGLSADQQCAQFRIPTRTARGIELERRLIIEPVLIGRIKSCIGRFRVVERPLPHLVLDHHSFTQRV